MAEQRIDIILDEDGDFPLEDVYIGGVIQDTKMDKSDNQHLLDLIIYNQGWLKNNPSVPVFAVQTYFNSEGQIQKADKMIKIVMDTDGYNTRHGVIAPDGNGGFIVSTKYIDRK